LVLLAALSKISATCFFETRSDIDDPLANLHAATLIGKAGIPTTTSAEEGSGASEATCGEKM
jgi:hypothetical protein